MWRLNRRLDRRFKPWLFCAACRRGHMATEGWTFYCLHAHRQVRVAEMYVDVEMAPHIAALHFLGVDTESSCQGTNDHAPFILLRHADDIPEALRALPCGYSARIVPFGSARLTLRSDR